MTNLTISLEDELIKQARIRVAQQGTSLSAKVRELLQNYVDGNDEASRRQREESTSNLMLAIENATLAAGPASASAAQSKRQTLRDEMYEADFRARARTNSASEPGAPA